MSPPPAAPSSSSARQQTCQGALPVTTVIRTCGIARERDCSSGGKPYDSGTLSLEHDCQTKKGVPVNAGFMHAWRGPCWLRWAGFAVIGPADTAPGLGRRRRSSRHGLTSSLSCSTTRRAATTTAGVRRWSSGPRSAHRRIERRRHAGHGSSIPREDGRPRRDKRRVLGGERGWRNIRLGRWPGPCLVRRNQARGGLIGSVERTGGVPRLRHPAGCARRPPVPPSPARWCARVGDRGWVVRRRSRPT